MAGDPVSKKKKKRTTGLVAQNGIHSEIRINASKPDSPERGRSGVLGGDRSQFGLSLRSTYVDLGIPMKAEIQSDSCSSNSFTDQLGAGSRTKHIDTRHVWEQDRVQDGYLSIKKVPASKILCRFWNEAGLCFSTTIALQMCRFRTLLTMIPALHYEMIGHLLNRNRRNRHLLELVVKIEMVATLSVNNFNGGRVEHCAR